MPAFVLCLLAAVAAAESPAAAETDARRRGCTVNAQGRSECEHLPLAGDSVLLQRRAESAAIRANKSKAGTWCCSGCSGYCSPQSGSCYGEKLKDYYTACGGDGGEGGLAPPPPPPSTCCAKCGGAGKAYCSPESGTCYAVKRKDYYLSCGGGMKPSELVWEDNFDGTAVDRTKWIFWEGTAFNDEKQVYTDREENVQVSGGTLKLIGKCEEMWWEGQQLRYTSGKLETRGKADWGPNHRVEVRAKLPIGRGAWPAIWMLPTENKYGNWPNSGEIDIMESVGCTRGKVYGTVHTEAFNHMKKTQVGESYGTDETQWRVYTIDWEETAIHWYVDGQYYFTFTGDVKDPKQWPFMEKFYLILNVAVGGNWGGFCIPGGYPSCTDGDAFQSPQVMEVDYVRVWALRPTELEA